MTSSAKKTTARIRAVTALALLAAVTACHSASGHRASTPTSVPASALDGLLLSPDDISAVMGTSALVADPPSTSPRDHRILMPNVNCLGIWEVAEKAIYDDSGFTGMRDQYMREPDTDAWEALVIQAAVTYPSNDAAKAFFAASADRWSKCTNHQVNITINNQRQMSWWFGNLTKTDTQLTMPVTRGADERTCQHALSVVMNLIIDVTACSPTVTDQAATIMKKIKDRINS